MGDTHTQELTLSEAQDRIRQIEEENRALRSDARRQTVERRVEEIGAMGLSEHPGLLKEIRNIMLSDDGQPALMLSEDGSGKAESLTASDIVERIIAAMPKKDDRIALSEQAFNAEPGSHDGRPGDGDKTVDERTAEAFNALGIPTPAPNGAGGRA